MVFVAKPKRSNSVHTKRRTGQHHNSKHDHYLKTYWPYLPLILIVVLGLAFSNFWGHTNRDVLGYATDLSVNGLLEQTNDQRTGNSLGALAINAQLNQAAQAKANDMVARNYWSHNTPDGDAPWVFFNNAGYQYQTAGENLAYGFYTSSDTVTGWMNSEGHRANILNNTYKDVGFGIANSEDYQGTGAETIVVAMYGSQPTIAAAPAPAASNPASTSPAPTSNTPAPAQQTPSDTPAAGSDEATKPVETNATPATGAGQNSQASAGLKPIETKNVSRIQLISGTTAPWSMFAVSTIAVVSIFTFFMRHGFAWHRVLVRGERFVMHHKFLDIALVGFAVLGFILTRTAGVIH